MCVNVLIISKAFLLRSCLTILVVVDRLTKMALFIPTTKSMAAPEVASLFLQHVVRPHGLPDMMVSDRDPVFTSHF